MLRVSSDTVTFPTKILIEFWSMQQLRGFYIKDLKVILLTFNKGT